MPLSVILLERKFRILTLNIVYNKDNNAQVRILIYSLLVFLLKETLMPAIFLTYRPLKHLSNLSLISRVNVILVIYLFFPNFPYSPSPCDGWRTPYVTWRRHTSHNCRTTCRTLVSAKDQS
jgi:hypothetical protein